MRTHKIELGDISFDVALTFGAAKEISSAVHDLLSMHREATLELDMKAVGIVYQPKFSLTTDNVPTILYIGAKAAGEKIGLAEIQEAAFDFGLVNSKAAVLGYLVKMISAKGEEKADEGGKSAGE